MYFLEYFEIIYVINDLPVIIYYLSFNRNSVEVTVETRRKWRLIISDCQDRLKKIIQIHTPGQIIKLWDVDVKWSFAR